MTTVNDDDGPGALIGPDWRIERTVASQPWDTGGPPLPDYLVAETVARVEYAGLPWARRLVTPPPVGWRGGYIGRAVGWCQARRADRRPAPELDPA